MARIHAAIIATALLFVVGQCSNSNGAAPMTEAEVYWPSVLPDSPLPEFILRLLHPEEASYVNKDDKTDEPQGLSAAHALSPLPRGKHSSLRRPSQDRGTTQRLAHGSKLYFYEEALQVGKNMTISFPPAASTPLGLLPRTVADSMPFSTSSLPSTLAQLGIAKDSMRAAKMYETLKMCETPSLTSEAKFCARSLEALVEGAMVVLGTRDIRPVTSNLPHSGVPREPYTIRAVRQVDGSSFMLSCHYAYYPYTVFMCHDRGSVTRVYMVEIEGVHSGMHITVASATLTHPSGSQSISPSSSSAPNLVAHQSAITCHMGTCCGSTSWQTARHPRDDLHCCRR